MIRTLIAAGVSFLLSVTANAQSLPTKSTASSVCIVSFDWDSSKLSQANLITIKHVAASFRGEQATRIIATGHTDTSSPDAYNLELSLRCANAVKDALVREGVPAQLIAVVGKGESEPLVLFGDGVRHPRNRRVESVIQ